MLRLGCISVLLEDGQKLACMLENNLLHCTEQCFHQTKLLQH